MSGEAGGEPGAEGVPQYGESKARPSPTFLFHWIGIRIPLAELREGDLWIALPAFN